MDNKVKNISIIVGALSLLIIAIAVFNNYLSDKEVNSSNKELNDILIKEYEKAEQEAKEAENKAIKQMNDEGVFLKEQIRTETDLLQDNPRTDNFIDYINPSKVDTISVEDFKKRFN